MGDVKALGYRSKSGHNFGSNQRFSSRPTTAPGPGQYIKATCKAQLKGAHMSRKQDSWTDFTPGP